ncbi:RidA family protein [Microbacterium sp. LMI12-1-1.1]|uniref:RidA family protein n=1 Tax=unclassified Microbacterium TaxID=2609290 RepID=UPI00342FA3D3
MNITRIDPDGAPSIPHLISQVVAPKDVDLVFCSGQVAWNASLELVGDDLGAQTRQVAANIDVLLASLGVQRSAIVKETLYIVDWEPSMLSVVFDNLRDGTSPVPASTLIGVAALGIPGALIEVDVVIAVPR